jgi:hypothetical protein
MKLIGCDVVGYKGLDLIHGSERPRRSYASHLPPEEPIPVQVRIRQYADVLPQVRSSGAGDFDLRRLPAGLVLDCCM